MGCQLRSAEKAYREATMEATEPETRGAVKVVRYAYAFGSGVHRDGRSFAMYIILALGGGGDQSCMDVWQDCSRSMELVARAGLSVCHRLETPVRVI